MVCYRHSVGKSRHIWKMRPSIYCRKVPSATLHCIIRCVGSLCAHALWLIHGNEVKTNRSQGKYPTPSFLTCRNPETAVILQPRTGNFGETIGPSYTTSDCGCLK